MSGFGFYLRCGSCGLTSRGYPFRYDSIVEPSELRLPVADRAERSFATAVFALDGFQIDASELAALALANSTAERTVCVPHMSKGPMPIELRPHVHCPRCDEDAVAGSFGSPPRPEYEVADLGALIAASRAIPEGTERQFRVVGIPARLRCTNTDVRTYYWNVERNSRDDDIAPLVAALLEHLRALGSECSEPRRMRAFTNFEERLPVR